MNNTGDRWEALEPPDVVQELRVEREDEDFKSPNAGGCWICRGDHDAKPGEMLFDMEFDTYYHKFCADKVGVDNILQYERGEF